ncbi:MAG: FIST signal transduction protein, partial [Vicingaceae bacterium]
MKTEKFKLSNNKWSFEGENKNANLVLCFGARNLLNELNFKTIKEQYPNAETVTCSTAGEIYDETVSDNSISGVAIELEKTKIKSIQINIANFKDSYECGKHISNNLTASDLQHILVLSDGGLVNGSELVKGINSVKTNNIVVTGGLAGDGTNFEKTTVGLNGDFGTGNIVCIGFYGNNLIIGHGSKGGWDEFGAERIVTKSTKNVLYELDGKNALELYKTYLGENQVQQLPGSALLFPLSVELENEKTVVRTILSVDEETQSMTFAGDIPEGAKVKLMRANFDRLIDGAEDAAEKISATNTNKPELALLISCVGRKLILDQRIEEEVEGIKDTFGAETDYVGFYSYGEISPLNPNSTCEL